MVSRLTNRQFGFFLAACLCVVLMGIYPPWLGKTENRNYHQEESLGYGWIISPPEVRGNDTVQIDLTRLFVQWLITGVGSWAVISWAGRSMPIKSVKPDQLETPEKVSLKPCLAVFFIWLLVVVSSHFYKIEEVKRQEAEKAQSYQQFGLE